MRVLTACLVAIPILASAQKGPFALSNNVKIERALAAFLSKTYTSIDSPSVIKNSSDLRVALMLTDSLSKSTSFRIFGALTLGNQNYSNSSAEIIWRPSKQAKINIGYTATLTTELRPNPTTSESLIETAAQASIIGARPTVKVQYKWSDAFSTSLGYSYHDTLGAVHAGISIKKIRLFGYVTSSGYFLSSDGELKMLDYTLTYRCSGAVSSAVFFKVGKSIRPFFDVQFPRRSSSIESIGVRKYFSHKSNLTKGFLAVGYDLNTKIVSTQFYLHI
jgi:hypothetical protein